MSDLNSILEKYKARSGDEQNFMDKHTDNIQVTDAPGGDTAKKAVDKMKKHDRKKHRQGLTPEEEEDMYESNEDLLDTIDVMIREYYEEEASSEEKEMLDEMMSSAEGYQELVDMVFEEKDKDDDEDDDDEEDDDDDDDDENEVIKKNPKLKKDEMDKG
jgi:TATA-binding protein-associated factor Taf7